MGSILSAAWNALERMSADSRLCAVY